MNTIEEIKEAVNTAEVELFDLIEEFKGRDESNTANTNRMLRFIGEHAIVLHNLRQDLGTAEFEQQEAEDNARYEYDMEQERIEREQEARDQTDIDEMNRMGCEDEPIEDDQARHGAMTEEEIYSALEDCHMVYDSIIGEFHTITTEDMDAVKALVERKCKICREINTLEGMIDEMETARNTEQQEPDDDDPDNSWREWNNTYPQDLMHPSNMPKFVAVGDHSDEAIRDEDPNDMDR